MALREVELWGDQYEFTVALEHYLALVGGIGSGKTVCGSARAVAASQGFIGSQRIPTPNVGIVTAPTYPMLRDVTIRTFLDMAGDLVKSFNKSESHAILRNGSEVLFRSTDNPEHLRGPSISWWYGDEAALYIPGAWKIMIGRLRQYGQHGYAWITTTPKGRNWIWQRFIQKAKPGYKLFQVSTLQNPFLSDGFVQALIEDYDGDFAKQELYGEFVAFEGLIYSEFDRSLHVPSSRPKDFVKVVAGVDWGFTNPGVIVVYGVDGDGRMWGLWEEYKRQQRIEEWANTALELRNTYRIERFFCDPSEPKYIQAFNEKGCKAEAANNEVNAGIQRVKNRLVKRADGLPRLALSSEFAWSISEFEQYQWKPYKTGGFDDQPMKTNDHAMDATRYAVMGVDDNDRRALTVSTKQNG